MKILSVGNFGVGWDGSVCDEEHIAGALEELGHEVVRWQREDTLKAYVISASSEFNPYQYPAVSASDEKSPDFVLIAQWDGYREGFVDGLRKYIGCPITYWAFDHQDQNQEWHKKLIEGADLYLSKRIADSVFPNWQWLCQDFAPSFLDKCPVPIEKDIDVLFTGSYLPWATERIETLKAVDEKFNLVIHSFTPNQWKNTGFKDVRGPIMDMELPELYARAKVILSIDHTIEAGYWSDRNAQIMACGGLVLFRYVPCSTQVFGNYVEYFHNVEQCLELIDFYLKNDGLRDSKAEWGYEFAQANLTVEERVKDLLTIVRGIL